MSLSRVITVLRAAQLYYQAAHNLTFGEYFFADHEFLGAAYEAHAAAYDSVVERAIGLREKPELLKINCEAAKIAEGLNLDDCDKIFTQALEIEKSLINEINKVEKPSKGTDNLLAGLADEAEARIYKIRQRLL